MIMVDIQSAIEPKVEEKSIFEKSEIEKLYYLVCHFIPTITVAKHGRMDPSDIIEMEDKLHIKHDINRAHAPYTQLIFYFNSKQLCDAVCMPGTYGYEQDLLELAGTAPGVMSHTEELDTEGIIGNLSAVNILMRLTKAINLPESKQKNILDEANKLGFVDNGGEVND
jgi:hypothetical protein